MAICGYTEGVLCNGNYSFDMDISPPYFGRLRRHWLYRLAIWPILLCSALTSANESINEYELKAAYLFNFLKFVEWPQEREASFEQILLCTFSADPLLPYLKSLEKRQVRGHGIRVDVYDSAEDIEGCHLIYLQGVSINKRKDILAAVKGKPVLTVGEEGQYPDDEEIVNFFSEGGKLRFDINYRQVRESGIDMSSRLLNLARVREK